jgi:hypothetical protein
MIKATELRKGNLFQGEKLNGPGFDVLEVLEILEHGIATSHFRAIKSGKGVEIVQEVDTRNVQPYERSEGLPLTEEWIKNFAFKRNNIDVAVQYKKDGNTVEILKDGKVSYSPWDCYWIDLEYVHDLQNLHFALTRVELNWEL